MKNSITIKDISREANVSTTTVSRVLNGLSRQYRISEETEQQVMRVARTYNYRPNHTAVSLRLKKSNLIGLVVPDLSNPFFSNIASVVTHELRKSGYAVILTDCGDDEKTEIEVVNLMNDRRIDGLLVMPSGKQAEHLEHIYNKGIPVVCVDRYFPSSTLPFVATHNYKGAYDITKYLINTGHKDIVCIQGPHHVMSNTQRVRGYLDAMRDAKLKNYRVVGNDFTQENGYLETKLLLQKKQYPTAIFGLSDTIIFGSMKAMREEGLLVPDDISLVTFDNAEYLDYLNPPMTSVVQPVSEIAQMCTKMLLGMIGNHERGQPEQILLNPTIVHRQSVKVLR